MKKAVMYEVRKSALYDDDEHFLQVKLFPIARGTCRLELDAQWFPHERLLKTSFMWRSQRLGRYGMVGAETYLGSIGKWYLFLPSVKARAQVNKWGFRG